MGKNDLLNVWYEKTLVGQIWRDMTGGIGFRYDDHWLKRGFPVSQQLPLSTQEYTPAEGKAHQFFANLLPEAGARTHIVRDLKIANTDFALLKAIGGECAGALSILPAESTCDVQDEYKKLTDEALKILLARQGNIANFVSEEERPRLSLAGAQDKTPILFDQGEYFMPVGFSASTHIMKFEVSGYRHIPAYECFLTQLAKTIALPVVECTLEKQDKSYFLLIRRYDRVLGVSHKIQRLHQEDFCQAMGIHYDKKYEIEGGPSFYDCYNLVQQVSADPIVDAENLLKWQMFNVLAGNSDGHAKNLSLLYDDQHQARLAPFYDLVCTRAIERIDAKLALSVGGEFDPGKLTVKHWLHLAAQCGVREAYLIKILKQVAETLLKHFTVVREKFEVEYGHYPALQRVEQVATKQCRKTLNQIAD